MIFRGPYPDVSIPDIALTPFVLERARELGDKPALIDGPSGRVVTYARLDELVKRVAASLATRGFRKGEVLGILSSNLPEYAIMFHGAALLGGVVSPINPLYTEHEIGHQLRDAGVKFLISGEPFIDKARLAAAESSVEELFVFGEAAGATSFASLIEHDGRVPEVEICPNEDLVALPYSSGTTGLPKGVMLTHKNLVANLCQMKGLDYFTEQDRVVCVLPLFHIYGLMVILNQGLYKGATIVTMPRFELEPFLQVLQDHGITMAPIVPPIVLALCNNPIVEAYDLSKLHTIFSGAAPLSHPLTRVCIERLNCKVRQGYGMTETSPVTHSSPTDPADIKSGSVGLCAANTECKIIDLETGNPLGRNQEGELCVRGPQIMKGYLNRPEATAHTIDDDGWLHTGDIGYADDDDHFFIVDRKKELIKYKGFQVAPAELEAILLTHPAVADAAVIPVPDDEAGEIPKAFVVLAEEADQQDILAFVAARVASFKKVRLIESIDKIPRSAAGKILRRILIDAERSKLNIAVTEPG